MRDDQLSRLFGALADASEPDPQFADELFAELQAEVAGRRRSTGRWTVLVAAVVLLAAVGTGVAVGSGLIRLPWLVVVDASPTEHPTVEPPASSAPTEEPADPTVEPSLDQEPVAGPAVGSLARTLVDGLRLREAPGTSSELLGTLARGAVSFVADGPVAGPDGHTWWLVAGRGIPWQSGCAAPDPVPDPFECPIWYGWAADGSLDGDPWLANATPDCPPGSGPLGPNYGRQPIDYLACFDGAGRTYVAWLPEQPAAPSPGVCDWVPNQEIAWLACDDGARRVVGSPDEDPFSPPSGLSLAIPPGAGIDLDRFRGTWIRVTGHFDDPAAVDCSFGSDPGFSVLLCRSRFVVEALEQSAVPAD